MGFGALTGRMPSITRPAALAAASAAAGAALYAAAAGGVASVDAELRAVAPAVRFQAVELGQPRAVEPRPAWDCPAPRRHAPSTDASEV